MIVFHNIDVQHAYVKSQYNKYNNILHTSQVAPADFVEAGGKCLLCHYQRQGLWLQGEPQAPETAVVCLQPLDLPAERPEEMTHQDNVAEIRFQWSKQENISALGK